MSEKLYYENEAFWTAERYLHDQIEYERLMTCVRTIPEAVSSLLDVGCGNGSFLSLLENHRTELRLTGMERAITAAQMRVCNAPVLIMAADKLAFADNSIDIISALEVIEHLPHLVYKRALSEFERVARQFILISVPYREYRRQVRCPACGCCFHPNYHMRSFDETKLNTLFTGFKCVSLIKLKQPDYFLAPVIRGTYRLLFRNSDFPDYALCPQCAFSGHSPDNTTLSSLGVKTRLALKDVLKERMPKYQREYGAVALYQRIL